MATRPLGDLDGVAPTDMRLPLYFARDAQRALDACWPTARRTRRARGKYPELGARACARCWPGSRPAPPRVRIATRAPALRKRSWSRRASSRASSFGALYSPVTASLVPELMERAEQRRLSGTARAGHALASGGDDNMSVGMQLSVVCAEDSPRITPGQIDREAKGSSSAHICSRHV